MWNRLLSLNLLQAGNHCDHCKQRSALITIIFISKYYFLLCTRVYSQYDFSRSRQNKKGCKISISSVQSLSCVRLFVTPWTAAHQASLSITNSRSLLNLMSIELVMPSNHLILCCPLLLLPSIFPSLRVFSSGHVWMWELDFKESWVPKNWCFWAVVLEKTLENPLDCKEIKSVNPKRN